MRLHGSSTYRSRFIPIYDKEGSLKHLRRDSNGLLYDIPRKKYTRKHPYPEQINHFKALPREKTAIIKMREKGKYSINQLSEAFGRSRSYVHKVIKSAQTFRILPLIDNRKSPRKAILYTCRKKANACLNWLQLWMPFILGEEDKPP